MFEIKSFSENNIKVDYAIDFPKNFSPEKKYPVVFYFHGMGMVQQGAEFVAQCVPVRRESMDEDMPFIIVAPHCHGFTWIEIFEQLTAFIDYIIDLPYTDEDRIYITGSSMGGYTCWMQAIMFPEKFAAGVICCGGGMYWAANRIKFPVWAFHGAIDNVVLPRESEIMIECINNSGGNGKLTLCEGIGHDVWNVAYGDKNTYKWLLEKHRQKEQ